jgi:ribosomal protein S18 acetylase RimI-like enzyme
MKNTEIVELYRKMGLGTESERERFLKWTEDNTKKENELQTFIIETPNSKPLEVAENAKLAQDSE